MKIGSTALEEDIDLTHQNNLMNWVRVDLDNLISNEACMYKLYIIVF